MPEPTPRRPHVLTLTDTIGHGGAERIAEGLSELTDPSRFRRSLCVTRPIGHLSGAELSLERLRAVGVEVLLLDRRSRLDLRSLRHLVDVLRFERVDVIHAHKFGSNVWATVLGRALRVPVIIAHEHTWSFEGQQLRRFLDRNVVAKYSDAVIAVSEADRRRMVTEVGMPSERVVLIPNGIPGGVSGNAEAVRHELGFGPVHRVLAQTVVLRAQKAIDVMLSAMVLLRESHPDVRLLVAGPGDPQPLRAMAAQLGLSDIVRFLGPRDDVPDILAAAEIGVLSSDFEGMPLAVLEYMAAGLPVVATDVGGVPELVCDGETGLLVAPRDPAALADSLRRLLDDPALARDMGERGQRRQQEQFSSEAMVSGVTDLYVRLLRGRGIVVPDARAPRPLASVE